jgi:hypothetical protein
MQGKQVVIEIREGPEIGPSLDPGDVLVFRSRDKAYIVEFPYGSPFGANKFHVPAGGQVSTEPASGEGGQYYYRITGPSGVLDPKIFVDP